jgi:hypothetical protein
MHILSHILSHIIISIFIIVITINGKPSKLESTLRRASAPNPHYADVAGSEAGKFAGAACSGKKAAEQSAAARALEGLEEWLGTTRFGDPMAQAEPCWWLMVVQWCCGNLGMG